MNKENIELIKGFRYIINSLNLSDNHVYNVLIESIYQKIFEKYNEEKNGLTYKISFNSIPISIFCFKNCIVDKETNIIKDTIILNIFNALKDIGFEVDYLVRYEKPFNLSSVSFPVIEIDIKWDNDEKNMKEHVIYKTDNEYFDAKINALIDDIDKKFKELNERISRIEILKDNSKTNKLAAWDDKNYFDSKRKGCPKCGSYRIMADHARDRGVILGFKCKDCGYIWRRNP